MDSKELYAKITDPNNLERAFVYTCNERQKDFFHDPTEIEWAKANRDSIISSISQILKDPKSYTQQTSFAYFPPKTNIVRRRMIFIPFKDLVIRYAFVTVLADLLDIQLSERCFANRRAKGKSANNNLLQNFAENNWPRFVEWQKEMTPKYKFMIKTDISSFYDSVSHKYLLKKIVESLTIKPNSDVIKLFENILKVKVASYGHHPGSQIKPETMRQGLVIGCGTDGFLANIYLKEVDELMATKKVAFGRYNDDMKIFANDKKELDDAVLLLQKSLLTLGLNLNSGKTKLASNDKEKEDLRSKATDAYDYLDVTDEEQSEKFGEFLDKHLSEVITFTESDLIDDDGKAKDFCKFLSTQTTVKKKKLSVNGRTLWQVNTLDHIIRNYAGASKHAAWLLVQSVFFKGITQKVSDRAVHLMANLLVDSTINSYTRYRILHLLATGKNRQNGYKPYIKSFSPESENWLIDLCKHYLSEPAIECNIIAIKTLRTIGIGKNEIEQLVSSHCIKPLAHPIGNTLLHISEKKEVSVPEILELDVSEIENFSGYF